MRALVTGGAGFLGSHLCNYLLEQGDEVICVDNLFSGSKKNIIGFLGNHNFEFIRHDVIHPFFAEVDQVYHLACPASPIHYQRNPIKTIKTNVMGTINMLGLAKRVDARILLASTSEVYGNPEVHPQHESYHGKVNFNGVRSCYDEGERVAETLMMDYHRQNKVDTRIVRIFNTYGPSMAMNDGRVVSNFIIQALREEPITIFGTGKQTRSFCYVDDLIEGIYKVMQLENPHEPINLGNPEEKTMLEIAEMIKEVTGSKSGILFKELPEDDPEKRCPDITKAKNLLGWEPKISLKEGLGKTAEWFDKQLHR